MSSHAEPDFARGQREVPREDEVHPDFARGQHPNHEAEPEVESETPDFARGQREEPKDDEVHPDFARGQHERRVRRD